MQTRSESFGLRNGSINSDWLFLAKVTALNTGLGFFHEPHVFQTEPTGGFTSVNTTSHWKEKPDRSPTQPTSHASHGTRRERKRYPESRSERPAASLGFEGWREAPPTFKSSNNQPGDQRPRCRKTITSDVNQRRRSQPAILHPATGGGGGGRTSCWSIAAQRSAMF